MPRMDCMRIVIIWSSLCGPHHVLMVGVPALIELPAARLVVALALGISVVFLVIQNEYEPCAPAEHNQFYRETYQNLLGCPYVINC